MASPDRKTPVPLTGVGAETIEISPAYAHNIITISGLAFGILTIRAKADRNTVFEKVVNGTMDLSEERTKIIKNIQLKELEFTVSPEAAYTVLITQHEPLSSVR